jgi:GNAT superfamily N-acetyltransferase
MLMTLNYETKLTTEFSISSALNQKLIELKRSCFEGYEKIDRAYYKQFPHHRLLAFDNDNLIANIAIDYRVITINEKPFKIFGLIDVCVSPLYQGQGIASNLLEQLTELGKQHSVDFLIAFATDPRVYQKNGFHLVDNYFQWLRISEHKNYGVGIERIDNEVWVKTLGDKPWTEGPVDLLGYLF